MVGRGTGVVAEPNLADVTDVDSALARRVTRGGASGDTRRTDRAQILGCAIDRITLDQAVAFCEHVIDSKGSAQHLAVNAAKVVAIHRSEHLRAVVDRCDLVTADGQSVVWASQILRDPVPGRVAGIDLMHRLLARAAANGYRIYVLGAKPDVLERAVARMCEDHPGLTVIGFRDGYFSDAEATEVAASIAVARPDILFVAMSSPRKEFFLASYRDAMNVPFVMGVGGAIDVVAGVTRRAPYMVQRMGLEWLFRLAQEPGRLARRYLVTNTQFMVLLCRSLVEAEVAPKLARRDSLLERSFPRLAHRRSGFSGNGRQTSTLDMS